MIVNIKKPEEYTLEELVSLLEYNKKNNSSSHFTMPTLMIEVNDTLVNTGLTYEWAYNRIKELKSL